MNVTRLDLRNGGNSLPTTLAYMFAVHYVVGKRVLDAGTGYGYGAAVLAASGASSVLAVDIDPGVIAAAKAAYSSDNLHFEVADCEKLDDISSRFDIVCNFENIEHLRHPPAFLQAVGRLLTPSGVLLCSTPDRAAMPPFKDDKPVNQYHVNEWYTHEFVTLLAEYFDEIQMYSQVRSGPANLRRNGAEELQRFFRENPGLKAYRLLCRLVGRGAFTPAAYRVATPDPSDFPIYPRAIAKLFGHGWCNFAVCRLPRSTV